MSERHRNPEMKKQVIIELWKQTGKRSAGAAELEVIQRGLLEAGGTESPASIARTLADHGVTLRHPEVVEADLRWRKDGLFSPHELDLADLAAANALIEKTERLRLEFDGDDARAEQLRQFVLRMKDELEFRGASDELAREVAQWLTVWLQTPQIFAGWLELRRSTVEFQELFQQ